jgi:hypothetical protein
LVDVLRPENLALAWKQVKANQGSAGIDGMEAGDFPAYMQANWEKIRGKLEDGTYKPFPVRSVSIPKDGGGRRPLGIPTVLDRVIQQAIAQVLTVSFVILCGSLRAGERILQSIRCFLADELKLIVNETKSRVVPLAEASFLGFRIVRRKVRWTRKSQRKFKAKVRRITRRTRGHSPKTVIAELTSYLRGAFNYYGLGIAFGEARELDRWVRSRVRMYYWKQWGRPRTRRRKLLRLGIGRDEVKKASRSRKGHWRMSHNSLVKRAMTNEWLSEQGVLSLEKQWVSIRYPDGPKKKPG